MCPCLVFQGNKVDYQNGQGVCTKTHEHDNLTLREFKNGAILLIRDPLKAAVSDFVRCGHDHNLTTEDVGRHLESNDGELLADNIEL